MMLSWLGVILAGALNGTFAVPLKTTRIWKFNHIWTVHSLLAMGVLPWLYVFLVVPHWRATLSAVPVSGWLGLVGWGMLFGIASLLYGVAVDLLGIALGFAIQLGLSIVLGSLLPLFWAGAFHLRTGRDWIFLTGLAVMIAGVILCAQAGGAKTHAAPAAAIGARFRKGLIIALLGGVLAPTLNFGIQYGTSLLARLGEIRGSGRFPLPIYLAWAVFLSASALLQAGVCFGRVIRDRQAGAWTAPGARRDILQVVAMSTVWIASVFLYGRSAFALGRLGNSFGWPIFIAFIILTSNAWGVILGEWQGVSKRGFLRMIGGSAVLVLAAFLIGQGSRA